MKTLEKYCIGLGVVLFIVMSVAMIIQTSADQHQHATAVKIATPSKTMLASAKK